MNYLKKLIYKIIISKFINFINSYNKFIFIIDLYAKDQKLFSTLKYKNYNKYEDIQIATNKRKLPLGIQYVEKKDIKNISNYLMKNLKKKKLFGICHGVRNASEVYYFLNEFNKKSQFPRLTCYGTDISPTIKKYQYGIQWDFNKKNKKWKNKFDFIYSNSLDHSNNPKKTLFNWAETLKKNGYIFLDHTTSHGIRGKSFSDPCAIEGELLPFLITRWFKGRIAIVDYIKHYNPVKRNSQRNNIFICKKFI